MAAGAFGVAMMVLAMGNFLSNNRNGNSR
jgi:hypothetical protein